MLGESDTPYMVVVSATTTSDTLSSYSNYGAIVDAAAPGDGIYSTGITGTRAGSGTSFAAPIVAGVVALVLSANPSLTSAQAVQILKDSADDLGAPGMDPQFGSGRVNAYRVVTMAQAYTPPPPPPAPAPHHHHSVSPWWLLLLLLGFIR